MFEWINAEVRIRVWLKIGSGPLYLKRREIFTILLYKYFRWFHMPSFLFSHFWCQTSSVSPRAPDSDLVRILTDPGWLLHLWNAWHQKYENEKGGFWNYQKIHSIKFLKSPCVWGTESRIRCFGQHRSFNPEWTNATLLESMSGENY